MSKGANLCTFYSSSIQTVLFLYLHRLGAYLPTYNFGVFRLTITKLAQLIVWATFFVKEFEFDVENRNSSIVVFFCEV